MLSKHSLLTCILFNWTQNPRTPINVCRLSPVGKGAITVHSFVTLRYITYLLGLLYNTTWPLPPSGLEKKAMCLIHNVITTIVLTSTVYDLTLTCFLVDLRQQ